MPGSSTLAQQLITLPEPARDRFWRAPEALKTAAPSVPLTLVKAAWMKPQLRVRTRFLRGAGELRHATLTTLLNS
jgi:hypothetical protein